MRYSFVMVVFGGYLFSQYSYYLPKGNKITIVKVTLVLLMVEELKKYGFCCKENGALKRYT
jgi:hypothetical protein